MLQRRYSPLLLTFGLTAGAARTKIYMKRISHLFCQYIQTYKAHIVGLFNSQTISIYFISQQKEKKRSNKQSRDIQTNAEPCDPVIEKTDYIPSNVKAASKAFIGFDKVDRDAVSSYSMSLRTQRAVPNQFFSRVWHKQQ